MLSRIFRCGIYAALMGAASGIALSETGPLPPFTAAYDPKGVDERGLWMEADEDERALRDSKLVISDVLLNRYVHDVLCRTVGEDRCQGVRIYVMRVPAFNANMASNGMMRLWSGALLRIRSEAELAAVLGHEFAHFELRHSLKGFKRQRAASDILAWAGFLGQSAPAIQMAAIGSFFSFSRSQETEADLLSMKYLGRSSYDTKYFADIWQRLMDEADATALGRKQRSMRYDRVSFFATHPTNLDRATYLHKLASSEPKAGEDGEDRYKEALGSWRATFLDDQLKLNDFGGTEYLLGELGKSGWTADLLYARAELYRLRGNPRDLVSAAGFYQQAIALKSDFSDAYRGLGMALLRGQNPGEGRDALRKYLSLRPDAADAPMISILLQ